MSDEAKRTGAIARFAKPEKRGRVDERVREASGLAVSRRHAGVIYTHNDQGGEARLFALDSESAATRAEIRLQGVEAEDFEDIAVVGETIYLGDIGDNDRERDSVSVLRFAEPRLDSEEITLARHAIERLELRYPKKPRDCETLCVDPNSGDLYLVSKARKGKSKTHVYRVAAETLRPGVSCELERIARLRLGKGELSEASSRRITGGDLTARELVLRTRDEALLWRRRADEPLESTLERAPLRVELAGREQGEAIAFDARGGLFTLAEGEHEPLLYFARLA